MRNIFIFDSYFHLKNKVGSTFMRITGRRIALFIVYDEYFTYIHLVYLLTSWRYSFYFIIYVVCSTKK